MRSGSSCTAVLRALSCSRVLPVSPAVLWIVCDLCRKSGSRPTKSAAEKGDEKVSGQVASTPSGKTQKGG